jgi:CDP-glucose 4,6-dehydratase
MEKLGIDRAFWSGKRVFLTGHTGFKGGWLALWLCDMGAEVFGYALQPPTSPNFYGAANLDSVLAASTLADIRDAPTLAGALADARPEVVFHLAAQPLVRQSYLDPVDTFATNVLGTANLLEAARHTPGVKAIVNVTSDKCYDNREWIWPYRENDGLGGHDPYSSSKACAELVTTAYRRSFLHTMGIRLASVRAGNVIGGGDWAADRLVPDFFRAVLANETLVIRSPDATRPWQHVIEPVAGYLMLAEKLVDVGESYAEAWNFGPDDADTRPVRWIADYLCRRISGASWQPAAEPQPHEAHTLKLDNSKVKARLGWRPKWNLDQALDLTLAWHHAWTNGGSMMELTLSQIAAYDAAVRAS